MAGDGGIGLWSILEMLTSMFRILISMFRKLLPLLPVTIADAHRIMPPPPNRTLHPLPSPPLIPLTNSSLRTMRPPVILPLQPLALSLNRTMASPPPVNTDAQLPLMRNQQSRPAPLPPLAIPAADESPQSSKQPPPPPLLPAVIMRAPPPVGNPAADDSHPIVKMLQRFELGKISLTFAATAILGLLYSQKLGGHYKIVLGILSVCVIVWSGMALEIRNPRFGIALQLIGFNLMFFLLCVLVASFLRASLSWASWLLGSLFVIPSTFLLTGLFHPAPLD